MTTELIPVVQKVNTPLFCQLNSVLFRIKPGKFLFKTFKSPRFTCGYNNYAATAPSHETNQVGIQFRPPFQK